jgi:ABC-type multidrug transport system ATPase subunit
MLRILSGAISPDEGTTSFSQDGKALEDEFLWQKIAFIAPYQELPEEFSLTELIDFQNSMQRKNVEFTDHLNFAEKFGLIPFMNKPIREFSTGMKQKAKFILAMGSGRRIWFLDEPGSNLDQAACNTLHELLREKAKECLIILATNDPAELALGPVMIQL